MVLGSRCVADDAETDERYLLYIAHLGNGARFHIDSQAFGEVTLDGIQLFAVGDELVATANQASVNGGFSVERHGAIEQCGMAFEEGRHTLDLSVCIAFATPYVVIHDVRAGYYIHHFQATVYTTGHAGADDAIGLEVAD